MICRWQYQVRRMVKPFAFRFGGFRYTLSFWINAANVFIIILKSISME